MLYEEENENNSNKIVEVEIDTEEIADFMFESLLKFGYSPTEEEIYDLADIVFDFFIHKGIIEEEDDIDE